MQSTLNEPIVTNTVKPIGLNQIIHGDCLDVLRSIPNKSIDLVLTDPPYGTTACTWDTVVPFEPLWNELERIVTDDGAIVMTASQPFTSALIMSNIRLFKYCWVWEKSRTAGFVNAKNAPLKTHEDIVVFSKGTIANKSLRKMKYFPQDLKSSGKKMKVGSKDGTFYGPRPNQDGKEYVQEYTNYPKSILKVGSESKTVHPTQKPVELMAYLIRTYTNDGDTVLDPFSGSCTTAVACKELNRNYICIEKEAEYVEIGKKRLDAINTSPGTNS